jgi:hypothetical protein
VRAISCHSNDPGHNSENTKCHPPCAVTGIVSRQPQLRPTAPCGTGSQMPRPHHDGWGVSFGVTPRQTCPRPEGLGRNLRSKTRWFAGFCNSHQVSHFATFFIDARAEISVAESRVDYNRYRCSKTLPASRSQTLSKAILVFLDADGAVGSFAAPALHMEVWGLSREPRQAPSPGKMDDTFTVCFGQGHDNDPSAGSPTETLLRLLLPLNDKVQWTSRDVGGGEPPPSPRSEHFTGPFNR